MHLFVEAKGVCLHQTNVRTIYVLCIQMEKSLNKLEKTGVLFTIVLELKFMVDYGYGYSWSLFTLMLSHQNEFSKTHHFNDNDCSVVI